MNCGTVASDSLIVNDVTFGEAASGAALVQGTTIHAGERTTRQVNIGFRRGGITKEEAQANALRAGQDELKRLANALHISSVLETATHMYTLARMHAFQRPIKENAAVALYVACRKTKGNTTMLIDLAEQIKMNVFDLGATYKKFIKAVNYDGELENIPTIEIEPVIMKYAQRLEFGDATRQVAVDAASILARMDRDWMVTGRQPMGLIGACLLLAARMNNFRRTLREVVFVVRAGEVTILKRLEEFRATDAGRMPVADFREYSRNLKRAADPPSFNKDAKKRKTLQLEDDELDDEEDSSTRAESEAPVTAPAPAPEPCPIPTPTVHALRRDADGFLIPALPRSVSRIDPNLAASQSRNRTATASVGPSDTTSEAGNENGETEKLRPLRKRGRPRKEKPQVLIVTPDDLRAENELETEIASIVERRIAEEDSEAFQVSYARAKKLAEIEKAKSRQSSTWSHSTLPESETIAEDEFEDDPEVANCLLDAREVEVKETIWVTHNHDWLRSQQDKLLREQMEEAKGNRKKMGPRRKMGRRGDGSVLGSTPVNSPAEASARMLEKRAGHRVTFSKNLNYDRLKAIYGGGDEDESSSSVGSTASSVYSRASTRSISASPAPPPRPKSTNSLNKGRVGRARAKQEAERAASQQQQQKQLATPAATQATQQTTAGSHQNQPMQIEDGEEELSDAETVEEDGDIAQVRARMPQFGDDDEEEVEDIDEDDVDGQLRRAGIDF